MNHPKQWANPCRFFNLLCLGLLLGALLTGCATNNRSALFGGEEVEQPRTSQQPHKARTLADLEQVDIEIEPQPLEATPVEQVLASYREALSLFTTAEQRQQALRRMADLTMVAVEDRLVGEVEQTPQSESQEPAVDVGISEERLAEAEEAINYENAIELYQELLDQQSPETDRAEVYYLLAKAYDLNGQIEESLTTLNTLMAQFPNNEFRYEVQFRRGEILFSFSEFQQAAQAYEDVLSGGPDSGYYEQTLYKQGWTYYKLSDYDFALDYFFTLLDHLNQLDSNSKTLKKIKSDAYRVASMSFSNLDGPRTARAYFQETGEREYEFEVYKSLAALYLRQERFKDAANAYETFVDEHPLHPQAPSFTTAIMDVYRKGGFPSLILPVKEEFVYNYGINSQFWQATDAKTREQYKPELKRHLIELAQHYHSNAQQSKKPEDYQKASVWYREFLQTFPEDPDALTMNKLLAETLFSAKNYLAAVEEFNNTAYNYETNPQAARAGYFGLVALQEYLKSFEGTEEERNAVLKQRIANSIRFANTFPSHEKTPQIVNAAIDDHLHLENIAGAVSTSRLLLALEPAPERKLQLKAWKTIANGEFDLGHFPDAEAAIDMVLSFNAVTGEERQKYNERMAAAIYKQAEELQANGNLELAAEEFLRVGQRQPNAGVRVNATYDAGTLYMELKNFQQAINIFTAFRNNYPSHPLAEDIPAKLAFAYEQTEQWSLAAGELEQMAAKTMETDPEKSRQALWLAAEYQEQSENPQDAIRLYKKYVWGFEEPLDRRAEGQYRLVKLYDQVNDEYKRNFWLNKLIEGYDNAGDRNTARTQYLAAMAAYQLAQPPHDQFKSIKLTLPLKKSVNRKKDAMERALKSYNKAAEIGVADFTTAATYQIGEMYRTLAKDLINSERPEGLNPLELEQYEILLEEQAFPFEDQAIAVLKTNADRTLEEVYDKWVKKSFTALSEILPGRYAKQEQLEPYVDVIY